MKVINSNPKNYMVNPSKTHHNFYGVCINAINNNKTEISNKLECIKKIEQLKDEKLFKKKKKYHRSLSFLFNPQPIKRDIPTLQQILLRYKELDSLPKIEPQSQIINKINTNIIKEDEKNSKEEIMKLKKDLKPRKTRKTILYEPHNLKNSENLPKRYATFKKILEYLESNNITLKEYVEHNPFQTKPYQIPKSFEFLSAVKFKNYQFIREALKYSDKYLFCFDYYGQTCYHWAAKLGNIDLLAMLIDNGKHHNQKDFEGRTPLYLAAVNNDRAICEMLMRHRANVHLKDNKGLSAADVAGSKELKYYLGDFLSQPYSNPSHKQRIANLLREKENLIKYKIKMKKAEERKSLKENKK